VKSLLVKINNKLNIQGGFLKAVSVLVGGTVFAQLIGFIFLPILTRIYSPDDYSVLGVYIAIVSILSVISCFRFEVAIPIVKDDMKAKQLFLLAIIINFVIVLLLFCVVLFFEPLLKNIDFIRKMEWGLYLIPIGVFFSGIYLALQFWSTRKKNFHEIAKSRVNQAITGNGSSLIMGLMQYSFIGLIIGQLFNFGGGVIKLGLNAYSDLKKMPKTKLNELWGTFTEFSAYPKYSVPEALANSAALQLPVIIIGIFLTGPEVGFLYLAMRILGIPMSLVGGAIGQVYISQAPAYFEERKLYIFSKNILIKLFKIAIIPFLLLALLSPYAFGYIFGSQWADVGFYILIMVPWYFLHILTSPLSMSLHIIGKQKTALYLQLFNILIRVVLLLLVCFVDKEMAVIYYCFSGFIFYFVYLLVISKSLREL